MAGERETTSDLAARLRRPSGATQPYERLRDAILSGELAPETPLVELPLAEHFQVSRTPVREALTRLEHDGLLARRNGRLVVRDRSPEEVLDIYETRLALEAMAARSASERHGPHDLIAMRKRLRQLDDVDTGDPVAMADANRAFHRSVWNATHNESLIDLLTRVDLHLARFPATTLSYPGRWATANKQHGELVDRIAERDPDGAERVARTHFTAARDIRLALWEEE